MAFGDACASPHSLVVRPPIAVPAILLAPSPSRCVHASEYPVFQALQKDPRVKRTHRDTAGANK